MKLDYIINKNKHSVIFCKNNNIETVSKSILSIHSDRNVLFVYDGKIEKKIVNDIFYDLKLSGFKVIKLNVPQKNLTKMKNCYLEF